MIVRLMDVNCPKGGTDKRCQMRVVKPHLFRQYLRLHRESLPA